MKKLLSSLFLAIFFIGFGQQKFRLSKEQIQEVGKIDTDIAKNALIVENTLNGRKNDPWIGIITQAISNSRAKEKDLEKVRKIICIQCYEDEWKSIQNEKATAEVERKKKSDSLENVRKMAFAIEQKRLEEQKEADKIAYEKHQDSVKKIPLFANPYDALQASLRAFSKNRSLTVFRKMDYNFAGGNIQWYMQYDMKMGMSKDYKMTKTQIVEKYIPKVSSKSEAVIITYNVSYHTDLVGYYDSDEVFIINSVVITGTPNYVVNLFLNYWPGKIDIGGYKSGTIATKQLLGDFISLIGENGKYKITITKGNMDPNYETTWGINKKK